MILNQNQRDTELVGMEGTTQMRISSSELVQDHLIKILTETGYKRPVESTVRETFCNAWDSHKACGKENVPVVVRLTTKFFEVEDKGLGLDAEDFEKYIMGIGESTKRDSADLIGAMGAGAKVPLSYGDSFEMICRKNGKEFKFLVFKGAKRPEKLLIYEKETTESNGVIVKVALKSSWSEFSNFLTAIKKMLCYFPNVDFKVEGYDLNDFKIYRNELFEWSSLYPSQDMHISLGGVNYPIDWDSLEMTRIQVPVAVKVGLNEGVSFVFNREELNWTEHTKTLIKKRISEISSWFIKKYNESVKEFDTFLEAYPYLNQNTHKLEFQNQIFIINDLERYSNESVNTPRVKGITFKDAGWYATKVDRMFEEFSGAAYFNSAGIWKREKIYWYVNMQRIIFHKTATKLVLVDEAPTHQPKEFMQNKYGRDTAFIVKNKKIPLKGNAYILSYFSLLGLNSYSKDKWRDLIKEWQFVVSQVCSKMVDERGFTEKKEFITWLEKKKEQQKIDRRSGIRKTSSKAINKTKGDITMSVGRPHARNESLTFDRKATPIQGLYKIPKLNVYLNPTEVVDKNTLYRYYECFKHKVNFVIINDSELKYISNLHNFVTFRKFKKMSKPFARLATALKINKLFRQIPTDRIGYINDSFPRWKQVYDNLFNYKNLIIGGTKGVISGEIMEIIIKEAEENNNLDESIMGDYKEMEKILSMFYFLPLVQPDAYYESIERKKAKKKLVASLILLQKYQQKDLELTPKVPDEVIEAMYVEADGQLTQELELV